MTGKKTSIYLPDDLAAAAKASGLPLSELVRRGLGSDAPDVVLARDAAVRAASGVLAGALEELRLIVREEIAAVLEDAEEPV